MLDGKATTLAGAVAKGRTLTLRLTKRAPDFLLRTTGLCAVPPSLPVDPEGASAPLASAAPYYAAEYVPGERLVLERNRFYKGNRVHHVDRFVATLVTDPRPFVDDVANGKLDSVELRASDIAALAAELAQRYGVNKPGGQFFIEPGRGLRMFVLNTSRPLFKNNPKLRQAINFAVDRRRLTRELGPRIGRATDQYLAPVTPGFRDERIYPLKGPDLKKAKQLAKGHMRERQGSALHAQLAEPGRGRPDPQGEPRGARARGRASSSTRLRSTSQKLATPGEPFDIADVGWSAWDADPSLLNWIFDGRTIGRAPSFGNFSYFDSPKYNRLLDEASRLTGRCALPGLRRARRHDSRATPRRRSPSRRINALGVRLRPRRLRRHEPEPRPDRGLPQVTRALAATLFAALVLIPAAGTHGIKEGGTFRVALVAGLFQTDRPCARHTGQGPAPPRLRRPDEISGQAAACGLAAGARAGRRLSRRYRATGRRTPSRSARTRASPTASPSPRGASPTAFERIFDPKMQAGDAGFFEAIVGARKMLAGKDDEARRRRGERESASRSPDESGAGPARPDELAVRGPGGPSCRPRGGEGASAQPGSVLRRSQYVPGERLVMERNRFYRGDRPQHVNRITFDINADVSAVDDVVERQARPCRRDAPRQPEARRARESLRHQQVAACSWRRARAVRMFFLNTSRPLFKNNPELRQALNFAVDRRALAREYGRYAATATDQYLPPALRRLQDARASTRSGARPRSERAALANGHSAPARLFSTRAATRPDCIGSRAGPPAEPEAIGLEVEIEKFPFPVMLEKLATPGEPYDLAWLGILLRVRRSRHGFFEAVGDCTPTSARRSTTGCWQPPAAFPGPRGTGRTASSTSRSRGTKHRRSRR